MAKRANPFVEDFIQQRKVHVGIKQFNNNEDRLQKVYEKTLELLFKGAKKASTQNVPGNVDVAEGEAHRKDNMKQLCIGADGTLLHTEVAVSEKPSPVQQCACGYPSVESQCAYCEVVLCSKCQHGCLRCLKCYCARCSLVGSEGAEICVSCYE